ncbi:MAG: sensor histidine kinase [SAR324 cluster bacterium]|nr:sensor histidine kinase [SAR324 cluster bacterium]
MARHIHDLMVFNPRVEIYLLDAEGRVLVNLIDNALRYTPREGQVRVELASGADSVKVRVVDTGQGIPPEDLPHVFDRFYRADKSRSRISGGSGIGLAIAKHILASHRSDIHVERSSASGTVFAFELPTRRSPASAAAS